MPMNGSASDSRIKIETRNDALIITIPGRYTAGFWLAMVVVSLFVVGTGTVLILGTTPVLDDLVRGQETLILIFFFFFIIMWLWMLFVMKPRLETIIFDQKKIAVHGAFRWRSLREISTADIGGFVLRPSLLHEGLQGTLGFDRGMGMHRLILFATTRPVRPAKAIERGKWHLSVAFEQLEQTLFTLLSKDRHRNLPLALQAKDEELPWLMQILSAHLTKLKYD